MKGVQEFRHSGSWTVSWNTLNLGADGDRSRTNVDKATGKINQNALVRERVVRIPLLAKRPQSRALRKPDACIEKVFTLSFELMGNQTLKKAIDLGKFLLAQK